MFRRAASLLEDDGQIEAAATLLHEIGDWEEIVRFITKHAPLMVAQGRYRPMEEWLSSLPNDIIENNPWLLYWMGICRLVFNPSQSQPYFEKAYEKFRTQKEVAGIILACWGIVHSIIYGMENFTTIDQWIPVLEELGHRFKEFPSEEIELRFVSSLLYALVYRQPQHPEIETWAERALSLAERSSNLNLKLQTISTVAFYRVYTGDFAKALLAINSLRRWSQSKESTPLIQIRLGALEAAYYRYVGLHEKCLKAVSEGLELSRTTGIHMFDPILEYHGATSALGINDYPVAKRLLEQMTSSLHSYKPWDLCIYHSAKTQEALFQGDPSQALLHIEQATKLRIETGFTLITGWCHIQNAYVMHELGRHREAEDHLTQAFNFTRDIRGKNNEYAALLAEAHFAFDQGEEQLGLMSIRKAFALGREGGHFSTWGPPHPSDMARLCIKALEGGIEVEYVQEFIRRFRIVPDRVALHLENWPWPLKICALGRFDLLKDGQPIQYNRKVQKKPLLMLKAIIALGGRNIDEERLTDILWPEADGDQAYSALTTTLSRLRQLMGEKILEVQAGRVSLSPRYCWVDVWAFEDLADKAEVLWRRGHSGDGNTKALQLMSKAVDLYQGHFLADEGSEPFWALPLRERLKNRFLFLIEKLGRSLEQTEQWDQAIALYQKGLEVDNLAEELYRRLMACYGSLGETVKAIQVYRRLKTALSSVLGIEPSPKTETLYRTLTTPLKINK
ncbi:MAG: bacterial transcriptional activator domain-containing protein [Thermodesulfobacteriota bacterium]|nr:bacterial transcriptional activator domain-containing protein [Thermodesulfobacteriota bacterium]